MHRIVAPVVVGVAVACNKAPDATTSPPSSSAPTPSAPAAVASTPAPSASAASAPSTPKPTDTFATSKGDLAVTPLHHASILFSFAGKAIYVDPAKDAPLDGLPKADFVFVTDIHGDHMDPSAIDKIKTSATKVIGPKAVGEKITLTTTIANGEKKSFGDFEVEGVPMYNLERGPSPGKFFHDKGRGDGFVFAFGDKRVYVSGDTECIPEMKALKSIDVAFVCMNLPYTMPPREAAECVKAFAPKVVFPYHFRGSNLDEFKSPLASTKTEVRERSWY
jgi:L-ascorbate metabolism protein UlaG (beta-lactamase superfamily)